MAPCEYSSMQDVYEGKISGISFGNIAIEVTPPVVKVQIGPCTFKIPQRHFLQISQWYLTGEK